MRIVSFLPAATELIVDLGLGTQIAAKAAEVPLPAGVGAADIAWRLDGMRPPAGAGETSAGQVPLVAGKAPHHHLAAFAVDRDALVATQPDVIVTEERCPICRSAYETVVEGVAVGATALDGHVVHLVSFTPRRLEDALACVVPLATLLGQPERGSALLKMRSARLLALSMHVARYLVHSGQQRPRVAFVAVADGADGADGPDAMAPLRTPGMWVPDLVDAAGGVPVLMTSGDEPAPVRPEIVAGAQPEVLILGVTAELQGRAAELRRLLKGWDWGDLPAVRHGRTWAVQFDGLFTNANPRLVDAVEVLLRIISPAALGANGTPPGPDRAIPLLAP